MRFRVLRPRLRPGWAAAAQLAAASTVVVILAAASTAPAEASSQGGRHHDGRPAVPATGSTSALSTGKLTDSTAITPAQFANYWLVTAHGAVMRAGRAKNLQPSLRGLSGQVAGIAAVADGAGFWIATTTGQVRAAGSVAPGSAARIRGLRGKAVGITAAPGGHGYWLVTSAGKVYGRGDARGFSCGRRIKITGPVVGLAATPSGAGYWLATSAGKVYSCGDAGQLRFAGGKRRIRGVVGITPAANEGYWLVSASGAVSAFGAARVFRASGARLHGQRIVGMTMTATGSGYWLAAANGHVFGYGDARVAASARTMHGPVTGMASYVDSVSPLTKVIPTSATKGLTGTPGGTQVLTLGSGAPKVKPGEILNSGRSPKAPDGYLLNAVSVTTSGGVQTVTTTPATLNQAVPTGSFAYHATLVPSAKAAARAGRPKWRWVAGPASTRVQAEHGIPYIGPFQCLFKTTANFSGNISFDPTVTLWVHMGIKWGGPLGIVPEPWVSAYLGAGVSESIRGSLTASQNASCSVDAELLKLPLPPFAIQAGPVTITVNPELVLKVSGSLSATAAAAASVSQSLSTNAFVYDDKGSVSTGSSHSSTFTHSESIQGTVSAEADLEAELNFLIYDVAGPGVDVGAGLNLSATVGSPQPEPWWTLQGCLFAGIIMAIPALDFDDGYPQLFQKCVVIATGGASTVPTPPSVTTTTLPAAMDGQAYSAQIKETGGTAPLTWSASGLPAGLSINPATGLISGTPTVNALNYGTFHPFITVSDSEIPSRSGNATLTMTVAPTPPTVATTSLPTATAGSYYLAQLQEAGGSGSLTWSATGLPAGLSVSSVTGEISGTPLQSGSFDPVISVTDGESPPKTGTAKLPLTVAAPAELQVASEVLSGTESLQFAGSLPASGGIGPYTWTATGLPSGWSVNSATGRVTGPLPSTAQQVVIHVAVADSSVPSLTASGTMTINVSPGVSITTADLSAGTQGQAYTATVTAAGGQAPYTWSASGLPSGLAIDPATGAITGTPTASGTFTVTLGVSDSGAPQTQASSQLSLAIWTPLTITSTQAELNQASYGGVFATVPGTACIPINPGQFFWHYPMTASGGSGSYTWSASDVPSGLSIDPSTGLLTDVWPTAYSQGNYTITVTAADNNDPGNSSSASYLLTPYCEPPPT